MKISKHQGALRARSGKLSGYALAFILMLILFFAAGLGTVGSFCSTGKTLRYVKGENTNIAVYNLELKNKQSEWKEMYINVGSIYTSFGSDVKITVKKSTGRTSGSYFASVSTLELGNIYSAKQSGRDGANFNWIPVFTDKSYSQSSAKCFSVSADANIDINEIVCIADDGTKISLSVNNDLSQGFSSRSNELANAIDAQDSFSKSTDARHNFTQSEAYTMTAIHNVLNGRSVADDSVYNVDGDFNSLATVLMLPSVAIFGDSVGALRLTSLIASCLLLVFIYLLSGLLFKDEKYGFVFALLIAIGGLATTVGIMGTPHVLVACAVVASLYFMYVFFAKGISNKHIVKSALPVLWSGLFAALAMAMNILAVLPVLGILVLFGFGLRRVKTAYANECNKLSLSATAEQAATPQVETAKTVETAEKAETSVTEKAEADENAQVATETENAEIAEKTEISEKTETAEPAEKTEEHKLKAVYAYKKRVSWAFAAVSFVLATFVLMLFASVITYSAYVRAYDIPSAPRLSYAQLLGKGIASSFSISNITSFTEYNAVNAFAWVLPLRAATVYNGTLEVKGSRYLARNVFINPVLSVGALLAFSYCTVNVIAEAFSASRDGRIVKRNRRIYLVLLLGSVLSLLMNAFIKNTSAVDSLLFSVFYLGFIPLAWKGVHPTKVVIDADGKPKKGFADILFIAVIVAAAVFFILAIPSMYGFEISRKVARALFGWMSVYTNGFFRI